MRKQRKPPDWIERVGQLFHSELKSQRVFTKKTLGDVYYRYRPEIDPPRSVTAYRFIEAMVNAGAVQHVEIKPAKKASRTQPSYNPFWRYVRPAATASEVALSLRPKSYLSHASAARLHDLLPASDRIYANKEQSAKDPAAEPLSQEAIDRAFSNKPRTSRYIYSYDGAFLVLLNGKNSKDYAVEESTINGIAVRCTSLERTLVDMTVRPVYAGGVSNVALAFHRAKNRIAVPALLKVLARLEHSYPHHQALGFYLQRCGFSAQDLKPIRSLGLNFNFYLANAMKSPRFDEEWRVYYPKDL